jgi:hypothetical protein
VASVPLLFSTSNRPGALIIRANTWGKWSHVAGVDVLRGEVIEAVWPRVRIVPLDAWLADHPKHVVSWLPAAEPHAVISAARSQEGKPYDLFGALGLGLHRDWQESDKWWCSELWAWAFAAGGAPLFRPESMHRVTPEHLWMLSPMSANDHHFLVALNSR